MFAVSCIVFYLYSLFCNSLCSKTEIAGNLAKVFRQIKKSKEFLFSFSLSQSETFDCQTSRNLDTHVTLVLLT